MTVTSIDIDGGGAEPTPPSLRAVAHRLGHNNTGPWRRVMGTTMQYERHHCIAWARVEVRAPSCDTLASRG